MMGWVRSLTIKDFFAFIGAVALVLGLVETLFNIIPKLGKLRISFWGYLARKWNYKKLDALLYCISDPGTFIIDSKTHKEYHGC